MDKPIDVINTQLHYIKDDISRISNYTQQIKSDIHDIKTFIHQFEKEKKEQDDKEKKNS